MSTGRRVAGVPTIRQWADAIAGGLLLVANILVWGAIVIGYGLLFFATEQVLP